jgi:hypothetical protein
MYLASTCYRFRGTFACVLGYKKLFSVLRKEEASFSAKGSISRNAKKKMVVPWLRRLVVGLSPRRPGFNPGSVHVGFVVDKVAL